MIEFATEELEIGKMEALQMRRRTKGGSSTMKKIVLSLALVALMLFGLVAAG